MKKPLWDITLAQAGELIKCKDDNGEWMCSKGCLFEDSCFCFKNGFYARIFSYFDEQGLISQNDNGEWEIELE